MLSILAPGRVEMALAIGYRRREYAALGAPFGKRGRRFDEFLEIVTRLLAGEIVDFAGEHYRVAGAKLAPPPQGSLPLYIGGFAEKALERVARFGDGYFGSEEVSATLSAKWREAGRDPAALTIRIPDMFTCVADDPDAAMDELAPYYHHVNAQLRCLGGRGQRARHGLLAEQGGWTSRRSRPRASSRVWTPEQAIARLAALRTRAAGRALHVHAAPGLARRPLPALCASACRQGASRVRLSGPARAARRADARDP